MKEKWLRTLCICATLIAALTVLSFPAHAQGLSYLSYNIYDFKIKYGSVLVVNEMIFKGNANLSTGFAIPKDAKGILLAINKEETEPVIQEHEQKQIVINRSNVEQVRISYITDEMIDGHDFLTTIKTPFATELLQASLTLEPGATLENPLSKEDKSLGSIYPKPDKIDSDGQSLIFVWERSRLKQVDELSLFVRYHQGSSFFWIAILFALFLLILGFYLYYLRAPKKSIKTYNLRRKR